MKKIIVSIIVVGLLLTTSIASVNAFKDNVLRGQQSTGPLVPHIPLADIYVDDNAPPEWYDETHVKTIQEGINVAEDGDVVYVFSGIYVENIIINKKINLIGENKNTTIIDGSNGGYKDVIVTIRRSYVKLKSLTIQNSGGWSAAVELGGYPLICLLENISISDCVMRKSDRGIVVCRASVVNFTVSDCHLHHNRANSIHMSAGRDYYFKNILIQRCKLNKNGGGSYSGGISIDAFDEFRNLNIRITDCNLSGNVHRAIDIDYCDNLEIDHNDIYGHYVGILAFAIRNAEIHHNNIRRSGENGIFIFDYEHNKSSNVNIHENNIIDNGNGGTYGAGIFLSCCSYFVTIKNNFISLNDPYGIGVLGSSYNSIYGNTFSSNSEYGIFIRNSGEHYASHDNLIYHNNILDGAFTIDSYGHDHYNVWHNETLGEGNYWADYTGNDSNGDGIGDTSYVIVAYNIDDYPFMKALGIESNPPSKPTKPSGPQSILPLIRYTFTTSSTDPDGDEIRYLFDWDDGNTSWTGFYSSGATASAKHRWKEKDAYQIRVKAKDIYGYESDWSDPLTITLPFDEQSSSSSQTSTQPSGTTTQQSTTSSTTTSSQPSSQQGSTTTMQPTTSSSKQTI